MINHKSASLCQNGPNQSLYHHELPIEFAFWTKSNPLNGSKTAEIVLFELRKNFVLFDWLFSTPTASQYENL